jgi:hypothetical protein
MESIGLMNTASDSWCFKDGIMFIHHAVELLMKEILNRHSTFLVFENLGDAAKKQKEARRKQVGIFELDNPPKTISYDEALKRVDAFLCPKELTEDLHRWLNQLNSLRNQLEHYAIEADRDEVIKLLTNIKEPLLDLLDSSLGGVRNAIGPKTTEIWDELVTEGAAQSSLEKLVHRVLCGLRGKTIPSTVIHADEDLKINAATEITPQARLQSRTTPIADLLCSSDTQRIVIEIKGEFHGHRDVAGHLGHLATVFNARGWLITTKELSEQEIRQFRTNRLYVSGGKELDALKSLSTSSG